MKKLTIIMASILLMLTAVFVFHNCSKEKFDKTDEFTDANLQDDRHLIRIIHRFQELAEQQRNGIVLKSTDKVSVDSAKTYIDVTFNYTYCFHTADYNKIIADTSYISFPVDSCSEVLFDDVLSAYNNAVDSVEAKYNAIDDTTKKLIGVIFEDLGNDANDNRDLMIISQIGTGSSGNNSILNGSGHFDTNDWYWYQKESYNCYDGSGNTGAPDTLQSEIIFKYKPALPPGYRVWFTFSVQYTADHEDFDVDPTKDNYCDYKIYFATSAVNDIDNDTKCLDYNQDNSGIHEMDFYLYGAEYVLTDWLNDPDLNPDDRDFQSCDFYHDHIINLYEIVKHTLDFTFGIKHITPVEENYPISFEE